MGKPRVVVDTNTLVSAILLEDSVPAQAVAAALRMGEVLVSDSQQAELSEVLTRTKFDRYASQEKRVRFLTNFLSLATPVSITDSIRICRDPKDDKFLDLALSGKADYLVSGDGDLLVLHPFRGTAILTPFDFLRQMTAM